MDVRRVSLPALISTFYSVYFALLSIACDRAVLEKRCAGLSRQYQNVDESGLPLVDVGRGPTQITAQAMTCIVMAGKEQKSK